MVAAVTGVQGLGRRALAGEAWPQATGLAADLDHLGMQVTPANVLQVRNAVLGEARRLNLVLKLHRGSLRVGLCGGDPVSGPAAELFNQKIDALVAQCQGYVDGLRRAGLALEQTARDYGHAEQQITDSFNSYVQARLPEWTRQANSQDVAQALPEPLRAMAAPGPPSPSPSLFPAGTPGGPR